MKIKKNLQMYVFSLTTDINQIFPVFRITRLSTTTMHIDAHKVFFSSLSTRSRICVEKLSTEGRTWCYFYILTFL